MNFTGMILSHALKRAYSMAVRASDNTFFDLPLGLTNTLRVAYVDLFLTANVGVRTSDCYHRTHQRSNPNH